MYLIRSRWNSSFLILPFHFQWFVASCFSGYICGHDCVHSQGNRSRPGHGGFCAFFSTATVQLFPIRRCTGSCHPSSDSRLWEYWGAPASYQCYGLYSGILHLIHKLSSTFTDCFPALAEHLLHWKSVESALLACLVWIQDQDLRSPLSTITTLLISVLDVQDTEPTFLGLPYGTSIPENSPKVSQTPDHDHICTF